MMKFPRFISMALLTCLVVLLVGCGKTDEPVEEPSSTESETSSSTTVLDGAAIAKTLLDVNVEEQKRRDLFAAHPEKAAEIVSGLVSDLPVGTEEEYVRIPWIWRVSIASTKRLDTNQITKLLELSLPEKDQPLHDWQAVVIGGAVINGYTLTGLWPSEALEPIFKENPKLAERWARSLELSKKMADDPEIKNGTRYDALRMLGMLSWEEAGEQLTGYLKKDIDNELKQGAIGGLADLEAPEAGPALLSGWEHYTNKLKYFALEGMLRTEARFQLLNEQIEAGKIDIEFLTEEEIAKLEKHPHELTQANALKLIGEE